MGRGNPGKVSRLSAAKPSRARADYAPVTNGKPKPNVVSLGDNRISMVGCSLQLLTACNRIFINQYLVFLRRSSPAVSVA